MKFRKKVTLIICSIVLFIPLLLTYRLITLPTYIDVNGTITYKNNVYVAKDFNFTDTDSVGKVIGIAINEDRKRTLIDSLLGTSIREFKNDKEHKRIYVRWLMGPDAVYERVSK
ncbi:hypothetical protein JHL18_08790 [Clostridium sp. YIM B02505]|uniref:Uncharacterized protein n=1 Tax=Clostridium yunnanense TaxID=2800325 RepID=A0ABS1EN80_9CLOT|nr:hypothetical protein [Clostridium yunnanense]MBK1810733.1 hypothetical protein [Clostridium yunnanense]